jgi:hypothetical protein
MVALLPVSRRKARLSGFGFQWRPDSQFITICKKLELREKNREESQTLLGE